MLNRLLSDVQSFLEDSDEARKDSKRKSMSGAQKKANDEKPNTSDQLIAKDERNMGVVGAATWWAHPKAIGGVSMAVMLLLAVILLQSNLSFSANGSPRWSED